MAAVKLSQDQLNEVMHYCYANLKKDFEHKLKTRQNEDGVSLNGATQSMYMVEDRETKQLKNRDWTYGNGHTIHEWSEKRNKEGYGNHATDVFVSDGEDVQEKFIEQLATIRHRYQAGFTMHALEHIINGTWIERVFWTLKLLLAITLAIYLSWQLFESYLHHHVDTKVNIKTTTSMQLPMLFICGTQAKDYLATFNDCSSNNSRSYDEHICQVLRQTCPTFCMTSNSHSLADGSCMDMNQDGNVTCARELLGQCITVNAKGELYQTPTRPAGMYSQNIHTQHLPLWVYIKSPGSVELIPRSWFQFARINRHGDYHVILEKTSIKRLPYPYSIPSCTVQQTSEAFSKNIFIGNYTLDKCLTTCYTLAQLQSCGATHATYRALLRDPESLKYLFQNKNMSEIEECMVSKYEDMTSFYEKCHVKCTIPCVEDSYRVTVRYEPPTNMTSTEVNIYFYYQEMKETNIEHLPSLEISTLAANFGGQLGLMAGVSAISIIELIIWFVLLVIDCFYRYYYKK